MPCKLLDKMINEGINDYSVDAWTTGTEYDSVKDLTGQGIYKGFTFVVVHSKGSAGFGGMSMGSPDSVRVIKII